MVLMRLDVPYEKQNYEPLSGGEIDINSVFRNTNFYRIKDDI